MFEKVEKTKEYFREEIANRNRSLIKMETVDGTVLSVFLRGSFLFIPENGLGCYDCQLLCDAPDDLMSITRVFGGYVEKKGKVFFCEKWEV